MGVARFYKSYRIGLLSLIAVWRVLCFNMLPGTSLQNSGQAAVLLGWASLPYLLLAWVAVFIRTRWVLFGITTILLAVDVLSSVSMLHPVKSTAGLAALFVPLWQILAITPGAIVFDWFVRWGHSGFPIREKRRNPLPDHNSKSE